MTLKGLLWLSDLSGLAFHNFTKDIYKRAQRDFYFIHVHSRNGDDAKTQLRNLLRALTCKMFCSPIAGQVLA